MRNFVVAVAALALASCNPMEQADSGDSLAETFHQDFSAGNFDKIWNEASDEFRASTPRAQFDEIFYNTHNYYGAYQGGTRDGINLNTNNGVTTTDFNMTTTYEFSQATETFSFIGEGEEMALLSWTIEPVGERAAPAGPPMQETPMQEAPMQQPAMQQPAQPVAGDEKPVG